jgi:transcriptional regulator with XRE-family HTH domain
MNFSAALDTTLKEFKISGRDLASRSGVTEASISRFRRGEREIQSDSLDKLITALPLEAKQFLYCKLLIGEMDRNGIATLLSAIAYYFKSENTDTPHSIPLEAVLSLK